MSKPSEQMVLEMMLQFPSSVPNATVAVNKMLLFLGSGYVWSDDGGIVREDDGTEDGFSTHTEVESILQNIEKSVISCVKGYFLNRVLTLGDELEKTVDRDAGEFLLSESSLEPVCRSIHQVSAVEDRMNDWTLPCEGYRFYPISKSSNLNNIPDNVRWDWLYFITSFLDVLNKYPGNVSDPENLLPVIRERVRSLHKYKCNRYTSELEEALSSCGAEVPIHLPSMVYSHGCLREGTCGP